MSTVTLIPEVWAHLVGATGLITGAVDSLTTITYSEPANEEREALWLDDAEVEQQVAGLPATFAREETIVFHGRLRVRRPGDTAQESVERGKAILGLIDSVLRPDLDLGMIADGVLEALLYVTGCTPSLFGDEGWQSEWTFDIHVSTFV